VAVASTASAQISFSSWGADAYGSIANRSGTSSATSPWNYPDDFTGGEGFASDYATAVEERGTFSSETALLPDLGSFIEIGTYAETYLNAYAQGAANAVEVFTYTGGSTATFSLDVNLSGSLVNSTNDPSDFAGNFADVYVIFEDLGFYESVIYGQGETWTTDTFAELEQSDPLTHLSETLTFDIDPRDSFTVYAVGYSRMFGENGIADASSTLTVGFSGGPIEALERSSGDLSAIPEPSALAALLGLMGLVAILRRRR